MHASWPFAAYAAVCACSLLGAATARADVPPPGEGGLPDHPALSGTLGFGIRYTGSDASEEGKSSFFGRIDIQAFSPAWFTLKLRIAPVVEVDTLVGISLSHNVGVEDETHWHEISHTTDTRTYTIGSEALESRSDVVLTGGFKSTAVIMPASGKSTRIDPFSILAAGLQWHTATVEGSHRIVELYGLYNLSTSSVGATALWHNSIHAGSLSRFVFGMEAGIIPASSGQVVVWSLLDAGWAFEK